MSFNVCLRSRWVQTLHFFWEILQCIFLWSFRMILWTKEIFTQFPIGVGDGGDNNWTSLEKRSSVGNALKLLKSFVQQMLRNKNNSVKYRDWKSSDPDLRVTSVSHCQRSQSAANQRGSQRLTKHPVLPLPSCKTIWQTPVVLFELDLALRSQTASPLLWRTWPACWWHGDRGDKMRFMLSYSHYSHYQQTLSELSDRLHF